MSLDAEWLEVNNVFSDVMRVVEDARQKALLPLEERSGMFGSQNETSQHQKLSVFGAHFIKLKWCLVLGERE